MTQDMRFGVIRDQPDRRSHTTVDYNLDGEYCPSCHMPTEVGIDPRRRYCTNKKCNAMVLEDTLP
jgi:hypothetical protein